MSRLQEFDLIFFKGNTFVGRIIKFFTKEKYSHVALLLSDFHIAEADWYIPVSVRHIRISTEDYDVYRLKKPLTSAQRVLILDFIHSEISKKYDFKFLFSRWLNILFGIKPVRNENKRNCDEFLLEGLRYVGIDLLGDEKIMYTPEKLTESELIYKVE